jgi:hypothetical protein
MEEFEFTENESKIYIDGSIWDSNNNGKFKVLGKTNVFVMSEGFKKYKYLIEFVEYPYKKLVTSGTIKKGTIRNPYYPSICSIGYLGDGEFKPYKPNRKATKLYNIWRNMISRCYNKKDSRYHIYGNLGITVEKSWLNFQIFCSEFIKLEGYNEWKKKENKYVLDKDILCEKYNIQPKIYSKNTCLLISASENSIEVNKRTKGLTKIIGKNIENGDTIEFNNIKRFSETSGFSKHGIYQCVLNKQKHHKGWKFSVKGE